MRKTTLARKKQHCLLMYMSIRFSLTVYWNCLMIVPYQQRCQGEIIFVKCDRKKAKTIVMILPIGNMTGLTRLKIVVGTW